MNNIQAELERLNKSFRIGFAAGCAAVLVGFGLGSVIWMLMTV